MTHPGQQLPGNENVIVRYKGDGDDPPSTVFGPCTMTKAQLWVNGKSNKEMYEIIPVRRRTAYSQPEPPDEDE